MYWLAEASTFDIAREGVVAGVIITVVMLTVYVVKQMAPVLQTRLLIEVEKTKQSESQKVMAQSMQSAISERRLIAESMKQTLETQGKLFEQLGALIHAASRFEVKQD